VEAARLTRRGEYLVQGEEQLPQHPQVLHPQMGFRPPHGQHTLLVGPGNARGRPCLLLGQGRLHHAVQRLWSTGPVSRLSVRHDLEALAAVGWPL